MISTQRKRYFNKGNNSSETNGRHFNDSQKNGGESRAPKQNKKITFDDDGNEIAEKSQKKLGKNRNKVFNNDSDIINQWYEDYKEHNIQDELTELKDVELQELTDTCRICFENEQTNFQKKNPSDGKWLSTALQKGTLKDRANAGALLIQTNPLANIKALETLIGLTKISNKSNADAIEIITQLFISGLLPAYRKLISLSLRGSSWKALKKNQNLDKSGKDQILAYWHFETMLKDQYFEFLRNLQSAMQGNQDANKNQAIVCASRLLTYGPEKEQMLLSMLVNKLGDPSKRVASKALHHLSEVAFKHPAMCEVITKETEKILFRNNISEQAQHFALCFLSQLAPRGNADVCTRLVQICFSFFKIIVQKGAVNTKTMQAILRCLKRAIADASSSDPENPALLTKELQDTMYRLIHLADIQITLQTFALLLQIITAKSSIQSDRYFNALYKKMLDVNLVNVGPKGAAQFLHIIHRSIYLDANVPRAQAFIKRLLQVALHFPVQITSGCLIVINKLLKSRPELGIVQQTSINTEAIESNTNNNNDFDENDQTLGDDENKIDIQRTKYDPFARSPGFAGAQFTLKTELMRLTQHFHPTVQIFAQNIIDSKNISFYGDPLRDFCLSQFLDRFAFRNPRKKDKSDEVLQSAHVNKNKYTAYGGRGVPVKSLTIQNCTEDQQFIFQYLQEKRAKRLAFQKDDDADSINDDEFDDYLDGLGGKNDDVDFMNELGDELKEDSKKSSKKKKSKVDDENDDDDGAGDWDDEIDETENVGKSIEKNEEEFDSDDEGSISLDEGDSDIFEDDSADDASLIVGSDDDDIEDDEYDENDDEPKAKKFKQISGKAFKNSLKNTDDMSSLFAAADDFAEMLDSAGKSKTHGTLGDLYNQDKSSEKQLTWEENRFKSTGYSKQRSFKKSFGKRESNSKKKSVKFNNKKRK